MAVLIASLNQLRSEFNQLSPGRDKATDGWIGDARHQASVSDHNPDESGNPEVHDADHIDEVHAIDVDKDLRKAGVTMPMVVAFLVARCRAGIEKRLRYIIHNRTIWAASSGWVAKAYHGSNPHTEHAHFSGSYETIWENNTNKFHLELVGASGGTGGGESVSSSSKTNLAVDGLLGTKTIKRWQQVMKTPQDGKISHPSDLVKAVQRNLNAVNGARLSVDGLLGSKTITALQRRFHTPADGKISHPSELIKAIQRRLNTGKF